MAPERTEERTHSSRQVGMRVNTHYGDLRRIGVTRVTRSTDQLGPESIKNGTDLPTTWTIILGSSIVILMSFLEMEVSGQC